MKQFLSVDAYFFPFFIPLLVFFNKSDEVLRSLIKSIYVLALAYLFFLVVDTKLVIDKDSAETFIPAFSFSAGLLLLNARYLTTKQRFLVFLPLLISLLTYTFLARRNGIFSFSALIVTSGFMLLKSYNLSRYIKLYPIFAIVISVALLGYDKLPTSLTAKLNGRMNEDTRSDLFDNYFLDMKDDMVFGKGMYGEYFSPISSFESDDGTRFDETWYRKLIENGYLQLILNGGIVYVVLFVLTLLPAALLGIFNSSNDFTQACGIIILFWMIDMLIFGLPRLTIEYVLVWIAAGICYKKSIRKRSHEDIQTLFLQPAQI